MAESKRPFNIVKDRGYQSLMKTGRPEYYIPSPATVSRDVKKVFVNARKRLARMLQEHDGELNFATDTWTSPNHKAFVAVTVHFEINGVPMQMLLDMVEVATSHSGVNLAAAFAQVLEDFGISDKVSDVHSEACHKTYHSSTDIEHYVRQCIAQRHNDFAAPDYPAKLPRRIQSNTVLQPHPRDCCRQDCSAV